jgi:SAM-dependent methyltransferase
MIATATACRGCGARPLRPVVSLGELPLVNAFVTSGQEAAERRFSLDVHFCEACALVQLDPIVAPDALFGHYTYLSSASDSFAAHLRTLAHALAGAMALSDASRVLEIGSNDGTFLAELEKTTPHVLGVDPAANVAARAEAAGVPTLVALFDSTLAHQLAREHGGFDLVVALNVVAHVPDVMDVLRGVRTVLKPDGAFVLEVAYVKGTILSGAIDTLYHEHVHNFSLLALEGACRRAGLVVTDASVVPVQGGSLRVVARPDSGAWPVSARAEALLADERAAGLDRFEAYAGVAPRAAALRERLRAAVERLRGERGPLVGLGAPARGVVLMNYCGFTADDVRLVVDDTPLKQGKLVPGCRVPVRGWDAIAPGEDVTGLMLSWNYRAEVLGKLARRTTRGRVVIPLPELQEVTIGVALGDG